MWTSRRHLDQPHRLSWQPLPFPMKPKPRYWDIGGVRAVCQSESDVNWHGQRSLHPMKGCNGYLVATPCSSNWFIMQQLCLYLPHSCLQLISAGTKESSVFRQLEFNLDNQRNATGLHIQCSSDFSTPTSLDWSAYAPNPHQVLMNEATFLFLAN